MLGSYLRRRRGQGMTEYLVILALVAVALITTVRTFGGEIKQIFSDSTERVASIDLGRP